MAGLGLVAGLLLSLHWRADDLEGRVDAAEKRTRPEVGTMTTSYVDTTGQTRTVITSRKPGEDEAAFRQRHFDAVTAMQEQYPPQEEQ